MERTEPGKLAIILPCYNEEEVLPGTLQILTGFLKELIQEKLVSPESVIVAVNDGSSDRTWEIIHAASQSGPDSCVRGIQLSRNFGHQYALLAGLFTTDADLLVTLDADLQDDHRCIREMVVHYQHGCDIVYGVRKSRETDSFFKRTTARMFYRLMTFLGCKIIPDHADFRLMSRRALDMLSAYKEHNLYLRGLIPLIGLPSITVDDVISERFAGQSKYTLSKMLRLAMAGITAFSVRPMHAIFYIGMLFLVIAFCIGIYVAYSIISGSAVLGWASIILSIWLVGGFVIFSIGIAGMYIGNIYNEVKARPLYHIQEIL